MAAGSALFWVGSVWHGGGSNITEDRERQALFISHNCGWLRQQENQVISVPREIVREMPLSMQRRLGWKDGKIVVLSRFARCPSR